MLKLKLFVVLMVVLTGTGATAGLSVTLPVVRLFAVTLKPAVAPVPVVTAVAKFASAAVNLPVSVGDALSTALPVPVTAYSPTTPALLYNTRVFVPLVIVVVPMVIPPPAAPQDSTPAPLFVNTPLALAGQPEIPVVGGKPVALVSVTDDGVPNAGVTNVGDVANTTDPLPVDVFPNNVTVPAAFGQVTVRSVLKDCTLKVIVFPVLASVNFGPVPSV